MLSTIFWVRAVDQDISHLTLNDRQTLKRSASLSGTLHLDAVRCYWSIYVLIYLYYKKVKPKNPPCSREVFRHWWVTIIKTPKVRKMTQASLFDSFYASHQNERVNYVADFADRPCCHFQTHQQAHKRAGCQGEEMGGVPKKNIEFILRETVANTRKIQLQLAWQICFEMGIQKQQKSNITTCDDVTAR